MIVKLNVKNDDFSIKRVIRINNNTKISTRFNIIISFKLRDKNSLFIDRNFMFISQRIDRLKFVDDVFSHIVDVRIFVIQIMNVNTKKIFIFKNNKLNIISNYEKKKCFFVNQKNANLIVNFDNHRSISFVSKN